MLQVYKVLEVLLKVSLHFAVRQVSLWPVIDPVFFKTKVDAVVVVLAGHLEHLYSHSHR